jgi:hypothetical protein
MVRVLRYFTVKIDRFEPHNVGDICDFGEDENKRLVDSGCCEWVKEDKMLKPKIERKSRKRNKK